MQSKYAPTQQSINKFKRTRRLFLEILEITPLTSIFNQSSFEVDQQKEIRTNILPFFMRRF